MAIDLSKLTPAPWEAYPRHACNDGSQDDYLGWDVDGPPEAMLRGQYASGADAQFVALARNAFDVMMRRGWVPSREYLWGDPERRDKAAWIVRHPRTTESIAKGGSAYRLEIGPIVGNLGPQLIWADDPFTALLEADKWYREHVEQESKP